MAQYEADKIIQLLRFCSWKARTEMSHTGLMELAAKLDGDSSDLIPNEKYFVDLLSNANTALKKDQPVMKRESYIQLLIDFTGYDRWDDWKNALSATSEYIHLEKLDLTSFSELKIGVWYSELLEKKLRPLLSHIKKTKDYGIPLEQIVCKEEAPANYTAQLLARLEDCAFIVWAIPVGWKDQPNQMKNPTWNELMDTGRVIPVWIDPEDPWQKATPFIPAAGNQSAVIGKPNGLLNSLLYLDEKLQEQLNPSRIAKDEPVAKSLNGHNFHDQSNGFFNHGNVNQTVQHIGGDQHQHYNTDKGI